MATSEKARVCKNCNKFYPLLFNAVDVVTSEEVEAGQRICSANNVAWGDSPCVTGEFEEKEDPKPVQSV